MTGGSTHKRSVRCRFAGPKRSIDFWYFLFLQIILTNPFASRNVRKVSLNGNTREAETGKSVCSTSTSVKFTALVRSTGAEVAGKAKLSSAAVATAENLAFPSLIH